MPSKNSTNSRITPRDREILRAVAATPLTAVQLLKESETFAQTFTHERLVRRRLQVLTNGGWIKTFQYFTTDSACLNYYKPTPNGYRLLNGKGTAMPGGSYFSAVSPSLQQHTRDLSDFIVHTHVHVHRLGVELRNEYRENQLVLLVGDAKQKPDRAFQFVHDRKPYNFLVELDEGTEPLTSTKDRESLEQKIRFYEAYQDHIGPRFRVLVVFTRPGPRMNRFLQLAATAANKQRCLFYAVLLRNYLAHDDPLRWPLFLDHHFRLQPLVKGTYGPLDSSREKMLAEPAAVW